MLNIYSLVHIKYNIKIRQINGLIEVQVLFWQEPIRFFFEPTFHGINGKAG